MVRSAELEANAKQAEADRNLKLQLAEMQDKRERDVADLNASVQMRGQDVQARGQDLSYEAAMYGHNITARGQDLDYDAKMKGLSLDELKAQITREGNYLDYDAKLKKAAAGGSGSITAIQNQFDNAMMKEWMPLDEAVKQGTMTLSQARAVLNRKANDTAQYFPGASAVKASNAAYGVTGNTPEEQGEAQATKEIAYNRDIADDKQTRETIANSPYLRGMKQEDAREHIARAQNGVQGMRSAFKRFYDPLLSEADRKDAYENAQYYANKILPMPILSGIYNLAQNGKPITSEDYNNIYRRCIDTMVQNGAEYGDAELLTQKTLDEFGLTDKVNHYNKAIKEDTETLQNQIKYATSKAELETMFQMGPEYANFISLSEATQKTLSTYDPPFMQSIVNGLENATYEVDPYGNYYLSSNLSAKEESALQQATNTSNTADAVASIKVQQGPNALRNYKDGLVNAKDAQQMVDDSAKAILANTSNYNNSYNATKSEMNIKASDSTLKDMTEQCEKNKNLDTTQCIIASTTLDAFKDKDFKNMLGKARSLMTVGGDPIQLGRDETGRLVILEDQTGIQVTDSNYKTVQDLNEFVAAHSNNLNAVAINITDAILGPSAGTVKKVSRVYKGWTPNILQSGLGVTVRTDSKLAQDLDK
jgi:hypothetical protein